MAGGEGFDEARLRTLTCHVQSWIETSRIRQIAFGEETVTDLLLFELAAMPNTIVRKYSRTEEGRIGADFLLALVSDGPQGRSATLMLVQAKLLYADGTYGALRRVSAAHPQTATLIRVARRHQLVPAFAFYNAAPHVRPTWAQPVIPSLCRRVGEPCPHVPYWRRDEGDLGVTLAVADSVDRIVNDVGSRPTPEDLEHVSWPMPCLFGCPCLPVLERDDAAPRGDGGPGDGNWIPPLSRRLAALLRQGGSAESVWDSRIARPLPDWLAALMDDDGQDVDELLQSQLGELEIEAIAVIVDEQPEQ